MSDEPIFKEPVKNITQEDFMMLIEKGQQKDKVYYDTDTCLNLDD